MGSSRCVVEMPDEEMHRIFTAMDANGNGRINYTEWLTGTIQPVLIASEATTKELFNFLDSNASGNITRKELRHLITKEEADEVLRDYDKSGDHYLDYKEFKDAVAQVAKRRSSD